MVSRPGNIPPLMATRSFGDMAKMAATSILGLFFIIVALLKANSPYAAYSSVKHLLVTLMSLDPDLIATQRWAFALLSAIVVAEVLLGMLLLVHWRRRLILAVTIGILVILSTGVIIVMTSSEDISCGCLGGIRLVESAHVENLLALGRNCLLLAVCFWVLTPARSKPIANDHVQVAN